MNKDVWIFYFREYEDKIYICKEISIDSVINDNYFFSIFNNKLFLSWYL